MLKAVREIILKKFVDIDLHIFDSYNAAVRNQTPDEARPFTSRMLNPTHPWLVQRQRLLAVSTVKPKRWKPER